MAGTCAACKFRRKRCNSKCLFAPYFPSDKPQKFETLHRIFGTNKISMFVNNLQASHSHSECQEAMDSLSYEADHRIRDPVFGCVGAVSLLMSDLAELEHEIDMVKKEIKAYAITVPRSLTAHHVVPNHIADGVSEALMKALG